MADVVKEHILLSIPTRGNSLTVGCLALTSKATTLSYNPSYPYRISTVMIVGVEPVEFMRNTQAHQFLQTDASKLWVMDDDMMPDMGNAFSLLEDEADADIVAGQFYRWAHASQAGPSQLDLCAFDLDGQGIPRPILPEQGEEFRYVAAVGTGSTIIKRKVLEDPQMLLPNTFTSLEGDHCQLGPTIPQPIFMRKYAPNGQVFLGADLYFCMRAEQAGYKVAVNMGAKFGQCNMVNLSELKEYVDRRCAVAAFNASDASDGAIDALHSGWGNSLWSATPDYCKKIRDIVMAAKGPVLECGSGVSSIILSRLSQLYGIEVHTLEHEQGWHKFINSEKVSPLHRIHRAPLCQYDGFRWYDVSKLDLPSGFSVVVCDGPPSFIGRGGLMPVLGDNLAPGCKILMDDANRDGEKKIITKWEQEYGCTTESVTADGRGMALLTAA